MVLAVPHPAFEHRAPCVEKRGSPQIRWLAQGHSLVLFAAVAPGGLGEDEMASGFRLRGICRSVSKRWLGPPLFRFPPHYLCNRMDRGVFALLLFLQRDCRKRALHFISPPHRRCVRNLRSRERRCLQMRDELVWLVILDLGGCVSAGVALDRSPYFPRPLVVQANNRNYRKSRLQALDHITHFVINGRCDGDFARDAVTNPLQEQIYAALAI